MPWDTIRREAARFAALVGICGFAITQPVLSVFGDAPEQFAFRGATSADIVGFALIVAVVPAVVLWLPGFIAGRFSERAGSAVHLAAVAFALLVGMLQVGRHLLGIAGAPQLPARPKGW